VDVIPNEDTGNTEDATEWKVTTEQATWLRKCIKDVSLKPTVILSSWMPCGIQLSEAGAFLACYDTQHMSWVTNKKIVGNLSCVLPLDVMSAIAEVFHQTNFTITQSKTFIRVRNKQVNLVLNTPLADDLPTLENVQEKIKEARKAEGTELKFTKADIQKFMDNARAVVGKERAELEISASKGKMEIGITTVQGKVRGVMDSKGTVSMKIDYEYFQELITKAGDDITMSVVDNAFASMKLAGSNALIALNQ
jgi:hypothetical protein